MKAEQRTFTPYLPVVVDTNVLISAALLTDSLPSRLVQLIIQKGRLVFTDDRFQELEERIWKPKFDPYITMDLRRRLLHDVSAASQWVNLASEITSRSFCRDKDDDMFIHTALASGAQRIITGDRDLLDLHHLETVHIVKPRQALEEITGYTERI